jgi:hypothetical protein
MDYLGKGDMLTNRCKQICVENFREKLFVHMENFWDLLSQLIKHGTNTLHVAFIFVQCMFRSRNLLNNKLHKLGVQ